MGQYLLYQTVIKIINSLGRERAYIFARLCSDVHFYSSAKDRQAVVKNLQHILKTKEDVTLKAREVFRNFGRYLVDFFLMYKFVDDAFVKEWVNVVGYHHLTAALARGKGVVILTAHLGNWEMGAAVLNKLGHALTAIALPHKDFRVNEIFNRQRVNHGVIVVPTNLAVRGCVGALRANKCVAVLGDRDFGVFGTPMPFFGRPTLIPKGAAFFARFTGAAIVPVFLIPGKDGKYMLTFEEQILSLDKSEHDEAVCDADLMKKCTAVIEKNVQKNPLQWLMFREFGIEYEDLSSNPRVQRVAGARSAR